MVVVRPEVWIFPPVAAPFDQVGSTTKALSGIVWGSWVLRATWLVMRSCIMVGTL